jgi:RNA polymerase sigma-70 factor, ECF subfamily
LIDNRIIEECRGGNLDNFRLLVKKTIPFIYSVAFRMLGDEDQAEDVIQESLITVWRKIRKIRSVKSYKTWVYRIAINKCYDYMRERKRRGEFMADDKTWELLSDTVSEEQSDDLENDDIALIISALTNRLSPKQKAVFILSDLEQFTSDEISEITGISKSRVKANLYYARKKISGMIDKYL